MSGVAATPGDASMNRWWGRPDDPEPIVLDSRCPAGTTVRARLIDVLKSGRFEVLVFAGWGEWPDGYVLFQSDGPDDIEAAVGDVGILSFERASLGLGRWRWEPAAVAGEVR
jgi:hypothetical protein